jgi:hypothetical protein
VTTETAPVSAVQAPAESRRDRFADVVRRLAAVSLAGALAGLVVGGIGGRLAMLLLAVLNPEAHGIVSDDGFVMGRFDVLKTLNLLAAGTGLGLLGAAFYVVLRGLRTGPRWFQVLSLSVGPAVVVGETLVHTDGVDFRLLQPVELGIALFVLIPGVYAAVLTLLAERWLRPGSWSLRAPLPKVAAVLLVWVLLFPLVPVLVALGALWLVQDAVRSTTAGRRVLSWPAWPWAARALLGVVFVLSATRLADDIAVLT